MPFNCVLGVATRVRYSGCVDDYVDLAVLSQFTRLFWDFTLFIGHVSWALLPRTLILVLRACSVPVLDIN